MPRQECRAMSVPRSSDHQVATEHARRRALRHLHTGEKTGRRNRAWRRRGRSGGTATRSRTATGLPFNSWRPQKVCLCRCNEKGCVTDDLRNPPPNPQVWISRGDNWRSAVGTIPTLTSYECRCVHLSLNQTHTCFCFYCCVPSRGVPLLHLLGKHVRKVRALYGVCTRRQSLRVVPQYHFLT